MKYLIEEATLTGIADAVREKKGTTDLIQVSNLATEISNIQGGGTVEELTITSNGTYNPPTGIDGYAPVVVNVPQDGGPPESALHRTGNIAELFSGTKWNWFLDMYGKQMTMNDIDTAAGCFSNNSNIQSIPIDSINFNTGSPQMENMFNNCPLLKEVPKITIKGAYAPPNMRQMFSNCSRLRELSYDYFTSMTNDWDNLNSNTNDSAKNNLFYYCYSLRSHPNMTCLEQACDDSSMYSNIFNNCYSLNEVVNYPVAPGTMVNRNKFNGFVSYCCRLKNLIFRTNEDGTLITANWKNQTINLGNYQYIGYVPSSSYTFYITDFNSGITADKEVKDDATYQALKNDPDWFSCDINYSRYNHDSAVNTINSLPDTSAYLTANGGTNTIQFSGASGLKTDGGAINTLTEEEIAVATAKGWTVSLV